METTDRKAVCPTVAAARGADITIAGEVEAVRVAATRRTGPPVAVEADRFKATIAEAQMTRSRIPDRGRTAELGGKVHAFVGRVPGVGEGTAAADGLIPHAAGTAGGNFPARRARVVNRFDCLPPGIVR